MQRMMFIYQPFFWIEAFYTLFVIVSVFLIFLKSREMYKLTSYKGIKYFSYTFLFFALAYFFRFFFRFFFRSVILKLDFFIPGRIPMIIGDTLFIYTSVMAGVFMLYSLVWKKIDIAGWLVFTSSNLFALSVIAVAFFTNDPFVYAGVITLLFASSASVSILRDRKAGRKHFFSMAYVSLFFIWILNMLSIEVSWFLSSFKIASYMISSILYILILKRVLKSAGK